MACLRGRVFIQNGCQRIAVLTVQMACLMGRVFIQKSEVNLLSSVLDTPEFFWRAPDALQAL